MKNENNFNTDVAQIQPFVPSTERETPQHETTKKNKTDTSDFSTAFSTLRKNHIPQNHRLRALLSKKWHHHCHSSSLSSPPPLLAAAKFSPTSSPFSSMPHLPYSLPFQTLSLILHLHPLPQNTLGFWCFLLLVEKNLVHLYCFFLVHVDVSVFYWKAQKYGFVKLPYRSRSHEKYTTTGH